MRITLSPKEIPDLAAVTHPATCALLVLFLGMDIDRDPRAAPNARKNVSCLSLRKVD